MLASALLLGAPVRSVDAQLANKADTLAEHERVFLSVTTAQLGETALGLKKESLEKHLVEQLEEANISVSTRFTNQTLILEVTIDLHKIAESDDVNIYAFVSRFEAIQAARLATNNQAALASTWDATQFGAVTKPEANRLRDSVTTNLKAFLEAWKKSH